MKALSIIGCVATAIIGLVAMCLCSLIFTSEWSGFASFLVFICCGSVIAAIILHRSNSRRAKITALCIFIGLIGIAAMLLCNMLVVAPFSGFAGFGVFLVFAVIIAVILVNQKKYFNSEYHDFMRDHCKHDAAVRLFWILKDKGVSETEIRRLIKEKFRYSESDIAEILNNSKQGG